MAPLNIKNRLEDDILDLSMMSLKEVPIQEIVALKKRVKQLDLSSNEIESLPKHFALSLGHITKLDLGSNKLTQLPANFGELNSLKHLDLYNNKLTELPTSFGDLQELRWIDLKSNPLRKDFSAAAGDCSDYKECSAAAKNILLLTKKLKKDHEHQLLMKQTREKEMETARLQKEQQEKNRKKNEKKQVIETQKKAEQKENKKPSSNNSSNGSAMSNGHKKNNNSTSPKSASQGVKNAKKNSGSLSSLAWINFVLFAGLLLAGAFCFFIYSEGDMSVEGGKKAVEKLRMNFEHLVSMSRPHAEWAWGELKVMAGRASEATSALTQSLATWFTYSLKALEEFTGDMSPMLGGATNMCSKMWDGFLSGVTYVVKGSGNFFDKKMLIWGFSELRHFGQFLLAQVLVVWEEIGNNKAIVSLWEDCGSFRQVLWNVMSSIWETSVHLYSVFQTNVLPELVNRCELAYTWVLHAIEQVSS